MANINDAKNLVEKKKEPQPLEALVKKQVANLQQCLPKHMGAERIVRIALTTMRMNPKLYECTPNSFMGALFQSAQLGLEPNVEGQAYIIPFNNKRMGRDGEWTTIKEAQFQIGYKGYVELFYRHKDTLTLDMQKVREGDKFDFEYGTNSFLTHRPAIKDQEKGEVFGYYAVAHLKGGATLFKYMDKEECMDHGKKHSKCYNKKNGKFYSNTPWATEPDAMCMKTVLIQLMKLLPKSFELQKAIAADETIKTRVDEDMLEVKDETNWDKADAEDVLIKETLGSPSDLTEQEKKEYGIEQSSGKT